MKNSILKSILSLKNTLSDYSSKNYDVASRLLDGDFSSDFSNTWTTTLGDKVTVKSDSSDDVIFTLMNAAGLDDSITLSKAELIADSGVNVDQIFTDAILGSYTINDLIGECGAGAQRYEYFSTITDLFSKSQTVDTNMILNQINGANIPGIDAINLKNAIINNSNDNRLSQYAWLQILNGYFGAAKQATDGGAISMDTGSVYYISNIMSMVFEGVVAAIGTLCTLIGAVLGGIFAILGAVIGVVASAIGVILPQVVNTRMAVKDMLSSTNYIDGPIIKNWFDGDALLGVTDGAAVVYSMGGSDHYVFTDSINHRFGINAFLNLDIGSNECLTEWLSRWDVNLYSNEMRLQPSMDHAQQEAFDSILQLDDQIQLRSESISEIEERTLAAVALYGLSLIDPTVNVHKIPIDSINGYSACEWNPGGTIHPKAYYRQWPVVVGLVMLWYYTQTPGFDIYTWARNCLNVIGIDAVTQWIMHNYEGIGVDDDDVEGADITYASTITLNSSLPSFTCVCRFLPYSTLAGYVHGAWSLPYIVDHTDEVDSIPDDRCFTMNSASLDQIIRASLLVTTIMVGVIVAGTIVKAKINKWKFAKQMKANKALSEAKSRYYESPTTENLNGYYKAVKSYNRKAIFFGWPKYDAMNAWFDYNPTSSGNNSSIGLDEIKMLIKR